MSMLHGLVPTDKKSLDELHRSLRESTKIDCSGDEVRTKQEFADDSDVNKIIARCVRNNIPLPGVIQQGIFQDVSEFGDYAAARDRILAADDAFMSLSAEVRREFDNDPARLMSFVQDDRNRDRAIALGLIAKPVPLVKEDLPTK